MYHSLETAYYKKGFSWENSTKSFIQIFFLQLWLLATIFDTFSIPRINHYKYLGILLLDYHKLLDV